jgi:uncharacterized protein affecting Mg2+/Co2+ transport
VGPRARVRLSARWWTHREVCTSLACADRIRIANVGTVPVQVRQRDVAAARRRSLSSLPRCVAAALRQVVGRSWRIRNADGSAHATVPRGSPGVVGQTCASTRARAQRRGGVEAARCGGRGQWVSGRGWWRAPVALALGSFGSRRGCRARRRARPRLQPGGDVFEYASGTTLASPHGTVEGALQMMSLGGEGEPIPFDATVGRFNLTAEDD